jgi:hypothetical protein
VILQNRGYLFSEINIPNEQFDKQMNGYVYLLTDGEIYKIGVTRGSIENRIKKLQTGNPYEICIVDYFATDKPFKLEKMLHNKHSLKRVNNEWFALEACDVRNFKSDCEKFVSIMDALKDNPFF